LRREAVLSEGLSWRTHPFRHHRLRGLFGLAVVVAALFLVQSWARTPLLTALGGLLFLFTLWPFYFPVRYRLDQTGVEVDYGLWRRRWPWDRFQVYVLLPGAVLLTPFLHSHRLERFRAVQLPCVGREAEVQHAVAEHLEVRSLEESAP
jgi:hypothetical protein